MPSAACGAALNRMVCEPSPASALLRRDDDRVELRRHPGVGALGLLVHPGDGAAGQDVVELVEQHGASTAGPAVRTGTPGPAARSRSPPRARPRAAGVRCAGCPAWSWPDWCTCRGGTPGTARRPRPARSGTRPRPWRRTSSAARCVTRVEPSRSDSRAGAGEHLAGGAATAVAMTEGHQRDGRAALLGEVVLGVRELAAEQLGVVGVGGREVGEHPGAVVALPPEGVVRELVGLVPGDLLGEEPARTRRRDDLRQRAAVAERVGQPDLLGLDAELLKEEPLAVHELAGHRLAARHVRVRLDPHAADRHELACRDLLAPPWRTPRAGAP